jgi:hypothetical protein
VEIRFDPKDAAALPRVFIDDRFVCDTVRLDRLKNVTRKRRRIQGDPNPAAEPRSRPSIASTSSRGLGLAVLGGPLSVSGVSAFVPV